MRVFKISKSDCELSHVCLSIGVEKLGSRWMGCHEIWHLSIFRKWFKKIQVSLTFRQG